MIPENGVCFLVDGWEIYPDKLLSPQNFTSGTASPHYLTWAGEYSNFSVFHADGNPYGSATYRLHLRGNGTTALYLPEPLCAAKVFADGQNLGGPGDVRPEHYSPLIRDTIYSFTVNGEAELIIQIANYSHYYGGLWYPPAIGTPDSISHLVAYRMLFYGLLFFSPLTLAQKKRTFSACPFLLRHALSVLCPANLLSIYSSGRGAAHTPPLCP